MITLKTLETATAQEVFDQVATHLLTQKVPCVLDKLNREFSCVYRNSEGLKCAAGCLISDEEYNSEFEHLNWEELIYKQLVPSKHRALIRNLQKIHDQNHPHQWKEALEFLAEEMDFDSDVLDRPQETC